MEAGETFLEKSFPRTPFKKLLDRIKGKVKIVSKAAAGTNFDCRF